MTSHVDPAMAEALAPMAEAMKDVKPPPAGDESRAGIAGTPSVDELVIQPSSGERRRPHPQRPREALPTIHNARRAGKHPGTRNTARSE